MENKSKATLSFGPVMASVFFPGMGQIALGKKAMGIFYLVTTFTALAIGIFLLINGYLSYLDTIVNFDPNAETPDIIKVMHVKKLAVAIVTALFIHLTSIIHTIVLVSKNKGEE